MIGRHKPRFDLSLGSFSKVLRGPVLYIGGRYFAGAVGTTEELARNFHSMSNHFALAMFADRRNRLNRALEAVEYVAISSRDKLETFVVVISTDFALCHVASPIGRRLAAIIVHLFPNSATTHSSRTFPPF
jgi:hypothetical protein